MKLSQLFTKTRKDPPRDETSLNAQLLARAGFVDQLMAGVYSYLPLGLITLRKIEAIVRSEMNELGANEILMPILHPKTIWQTTGGWDGVDVLFKLASRTGNDYALGQSEEEVVTPLVLHYSPSYRDFPRAVYQIHWKYRDELRAKSGILRGREFFMKDMYSFHATQKDFLEFYEKVKKAYMRIFSQLELDAKVTEASGGNFSEKISYEFMVITEAGEDDILYSETSDYCINTEITNLKPGDTAPDGSKLKLARASEVGNVFDLGQKYPKDFNISFVDEVGKKHFPFMGCYGIGISRIMGVIAETLADNRGLVWPRSVAPADIYLIALGNDSATMKFTSELYQKLTANGYQVIFDDRAQSNGAKLLDADLIGVPTQLIVSPKRLKEAVVELKDRVAGSIELIPQNELMQQLENIFSQK